MSIDRWPGCPVDGRGSNRDNRVLGVVPTLTCRRHLMLAQIFGDMPWGRIALATEVVVTELTGPHQVPHRPMGNPQQCGSLFGIEPLRKLRNLSHFDPRISLT